MIWNKETFRSSNQHLPHCKDYLFDIVVLYHLYNHLEQNIFIIPCHNLPFKSTLANSNWMRHYSLPRHIQNTGCIISCNNSFITSKSISINISISNLFSFKK